MYCIQVVFAIVSGDELGSVGAEVVSAGGAEGKSKGPRCLMNVPLVIETRVHVIESEVHVIETERRARVCECM